MSSVNKIILVGRLGRDVETRFTGGGQAVSNFSLATDESYTDKSGAKQKKVQWHSIVAWGKLAEICQKFLKKGSLVYVEGKLQSREYEDRGGQKKKVFEVTINEMKMLDKRDSSEPTASSHVNDFVEITDEDIPF